MSKIIAFPKKRARLNEVNVRNRAKAHAVAPEAAVVGAPARQERRHSASVHPIWSYAGRSKLVSVILRSCGKPNSLNRCLAALTIQFFDPARFEIIIADEAPNAATRKIVDAWIKQLAGRGPEIIYRCCAAGPCPAAARNLGWQSARGTLLAFIDEDMIPYPDWLPNGVNALNGVVQAAAGQVITPLIELPTEREMNASAGAVAGFSASNCFFLKKTLDDLGGFDERFEQGWRDDDDLYFRMLSEGIRIADARQAVTEHLVAPAPWGSSLAEQRRLHFDALLYKKHPQLYREKIGVPGQRRNYLIAALLVFMAVATIMDMPLVAVAAGAIWTMLTTGLCLKRLRRTAKSVSHVLEMLVTSALVPPLAAFWRLAGVVRFRVPGFL